MECAKDNAVGGEPGRPEIWGGKAPRSGPLGLHLIALA